MITERDLQEAIAECNGHRNPNAATCIKLAAYYTIQNQLYPSSGPATMREEETRTLNVIEYNSDTEFAQLISGKEPDEVFAVMDELMSTLQIVQPRLYDSVMRKLS